ncbi:MAG: UDP-N-acetylglucosamine 2-epimerase (non-hydrolyzing) [Thermoleophilia bacterium]|nr:UDP-N-acetylglucosamine 2-epimerase (non-hydrolyzing) [Thermoleophilia bacterium]
MKVLSVVGNRPQFIKSAPLSLALRQHGVDEVVVHTGQHYDRELSRVFFDELGLGEPAYRVDARSPDVERMRPAIAAAIEAERPDSVLVYGDTNSTLAGARAAAASGAPLVHVEAGLRSGDWSMPEEHNRVEVDRLAQLLLAPDERSRETLVREGVAGRIEVVGDVMADASRLLRPVARERSRILSRLALEPGGYVVATIHREANVHPARLAPLVADLGAIHEPVVFPTHPRTRRAIDTSRLGVRANVHLVEPLGYVDFAALASRARVIVTDSGGLQKEAYWYGVPCVTVRPSTEWVDTVEAGANVLVEPGGIAAAVAAARMPPERPPLYGDGHAADRIAELVARLARS